MLSESFQRLGKKKQDDDEDSIEFKDVGPALASKLGYVTELPQVTPRSPIEKAHETNKMLDSERNLDSMNHHDDDDGEPIPPFGPDED